MIRWIISLALISVTVVQSAYSQLNCTNSSDDEVLIEYFNLLEFNDEIEIIVNDTGTQFQVSLVCPQSPSPTIPGQNFYLQLFNSDKSAFTSCDSGSQPLLFDKVKLQNKQYLSCANGKVCQFLIIYSNRATQTIYCQTIFQISMINGDQTLLPELEPATIPICSNTINKCLLDDTCSISTEKQGAIELCESSASCESPQLNQPNSKGYSLNESVYFQVALVDKTT